MRFMTIYKPADVSGMERGAPPTTEEMERMGAFIAELAAAGVLESTDGLLPTSTGAKVRRSGGTFTVVDGPFTEAKELIAGYAIVNVASKEEAIELTKRFLDVAGDGESEIRQMYESPAYPPRD